MEQRQLNIRLIYVKQSHIIKLFPQPFSFPKSSEFNAHKKLYNNLTNTKLHAGKHSYTPAIFSVFLFRLHS